MIKVYVDGFSTAKNDVAFAVYLESGSKRLERTIPLKEGTVNTAAMWAIIFALEAINDRKDRIKVYTSNKYVIGLLEWRNGVWSRKSKSNLDILSRLRNLAASCVDFSIQYDKDSEPMRKVQHASRGLHRLRKKQALEASGELDVQA